MHQNHQEVVIPPKLKRLVPLTFIEKAIEVARYHRAKKKENKKWTMTDTAETLNISVGAVSEELLIASWLRTHEDEIQKLPNRHEALRWIRNKKSQIDDY